VPFDAIYHICNETMMACSQPLEINNLVQMQYINIQKYCKEILSAQLSNECFQGCQLQHNMLEIVQGCL